MELPENFIRSVEKAELKPGDILFIRMGVPAAEMGPGLDAWFPTDEELRRAHDMISKQLPEGIVLFVTHMGLKPEVVSPEEPDGAN